MEEKGLIHYFLCFSAVQQRYDLACCGEGERGLQASIPEGKIEGGHDFSVQNGNGYKCALWQQEETVLPGSLDDLNNVVKKTPGIVIKKKEKKGK